MFAGAADIVRAAPAPALTLAVVGPFAAGLAGEADNLVLRAAAALAAATGRRAAGALTLTKNLPVASGIGGGSADAAAALRALCRLWGVPADGAVLMRVAAGLGADVPVCVPCCAARMGGVGDVLGAAPKLPAGGLVLVNPGVGVSTPAVFQARQGGFRPQADLPLAWLTMEGMAADLRGLHNDLEAAAITLCPAIADVLAWLRSQPGCLLARMSGSGATCFGLFANGPAAAAVGSVVPAGWWGWGGDLLQGGFTGTGPALYGAVTAGASPSGKAADFESAIRRFESFRPNQ